MVVISGKDKGRSGSVLALVGAKQSNSDKLRVLVEGINLVTRHTKPNPAKETPGGIIRTEASVAISNIAIFNSATGKKDKIGFKCLEDGRKVRIFKSTGAPVDA